jgi:hypothetical protein
MKHNNNNNNNNNNKNNNNNNNNVSTYRLSSEGHCCSLHRSAVNTCNVTKRVTWPRSASKFL